LLYSYKNRKATPKDKEGQNLTVEHKLPNTIQTTQPPALLTEKQKKRWQEISHTLIQKRERLF
ncbi:MAG: hypothetical protein D6785_14075, partial [Planctomycetota bacterium]